MIKLHNRGDTIVEVLIAMAVAGSVLGAALATMNRNLSLTRDAQERTEASKIAQGQIEVLKATIDAGTPVIPSALNTPFCLLNNGGTPPFSFSGGIPNVNPNVDNFTNYPSTCKNGLYNYVIVQESTKKYKIYVRWEAIRGGTNNQVTMVYKV